MKVYGSEICGDCRNFKALMAQRGFEVEYVDITESVANLRAFLNLRDTSSVFDEIRREGRIGIPAFVNDAEEATLDLNEALAWIGQPPVEEKASGCASCR